jgi:hypothetical protein
VALEQLRALAAPPEGPRDSRPEGWPIIPGPLRQVECVPGCPDSAVYMTGRLVLGMLLEVPGVRRHQPRAPTSLRSVDSPNLWRGPHGQSLSRKCPRLSIAVCSLHVTGRAMFEPPQLPRDWTWGETPLMTARTHSRHGLNAVMVGVNLRESRAIDRRMAGAR